MTLLRLALLVALPSLAHADVMPHASGGLEVMGDGDGTIQLALRLHAGASVALGHGKVRPSLAFGATLGAGRLDRPGPGMEEAYFDGGPELQLGVAIGDGGLVDNRVFAGVAYLNTGVRVSVGASIAELAGRLAASPAPHGYLMIVMPQQLELAWTRDGESDRFGVVLAYGF